MEHLDQSLKEAQAPAKKTLSNISLNCWRVSPSLLLNTGQLSPFNFPPRGGGVVLGYVAVGTFVLSSRKLSEKFALLMSIRWQTICLKKYRQCHQCIETPQTYALFKAMLLSLRLNLTQRLSLFWRVLSCMPHHKYCCGFWDQLSRDSSFAFPVRAVHSDTCGWF